MSETLISNPDEIQEKPETGPVFKSPEERKVTDRTFEQYLKHFCLPETELAGKKVLDIGSGLSDFSSKANEKFKESGTMVVALDPVYQLLGKDFREFKKNIKKANMDWISVAGGVSDPERAYKKIKNAPNKIAASHQEIPLEDGSIDLILASNSLTQYKNREITKKALKEAGRVIKEDGEIRIQPADLRWDWQAEALYVSTFEAPTEETRKEAKELGLTIAPDKEIFSILKEMEEAGFTLYATVKPPERRKPGRLGILQGPAYTLIFRKDDRIPAVEGKGAHLIKLSFRDSPDGYHVSSAEIAPDSQEKK